MKLIFYIFCLMILIAANNDFLTGRFIENWPQYSVHQDEHADEDLTFDSKDEFLEIASYKIATPSKKGYFLSIIFTATLWGLFLYLLKTK